MRKRLIRVPVAGGKSVDISRAGIDAYLGDKNSVITRNKTSIMLENGIPGTGMYTMNRDGKVNPYFIFGISLLILIGCNMFTLMIMNADYSVHKFFSEFFSFTNLAMFVLLIGINLIAVRLVYLYKEKQCIRYRKYLKKLDDEIEKVASAVETTTGIKQDILKSYHYCLTVEKDIAQVEPVLDALKNYPEKGYEEARADYINKLGYLLSDLQNSRYKMDDDLTVFQMNNYQRLCEAFELLVSASRFWDIAPLKNPFRGHRWLRVKFGTGMFDYIYSNAYPPIMQTHNNGRFYIYSKYILHERSSLDFHIIPLDSIHMEFDYVPGTKFYAVCTIPELGVKFTSSDPEDLQFFIKNFEAYQKGDVDLSQFHKKDSLLEEAALYVILKRKVSHQMIMKHFELGNSRTKRILNELETLGIITPENGQGLRSIKVWNIEIIRKIIDESGI